VQGDNLSQQVELAGDSEQLMTEADVLHDCQVVA
jgi:hypothetical protein